jgi:hypothetical protein
VDEREGVEVKGDRRKVDDGKGKGEGERWNLR